MWLGDLEKDEKNQDKLTWKRSRKDEDAENSKLTSRESMLKSGVLPWSYNDDSIEVALTGPAFSFLNKKRDEMNFTYHAVLAKAQVFARCSPEGKAELVESM